MDKHGFRLAINAHIQRAGLKQDDIATRGAVNQTTISNVVRGAVTPSIDTAHRIAVGLGYRSLGDFLLAAGLTSFRPVKMYVGGDEITIYVPEEYASKDITRKSA